jgi:hypothetical protein
MSSWRIPSRRIFSSSAFSFSIPTPKSLIRYRDAFQINRDTVPGLNWTVYPPRKTHCPAQGRYSFPNKMENVCYTHIRLINIL